MIAGNDKYGLPNCGTSGQRKIRDAAIVRLNKNIRSENKKIELANELRFYRINKTITKSQIKKLEYLEFNGY